jgi:Arc/MetJ-type ribon-helix-helix transcriptional regulator
MMTIQLPKDVESSIRAEVRSGHFASIDDALTEAWRHFQSQQQAQPSEPGPAEIIDPLLGSMGDHAELMDQIVEDAMRHREHQPWRLATNE